MQNRKSFLRKLSQLIKIQITALIFLFCAFLVISYFSMEKEMRITSENYLEVYGNQIADRLKDMQELMGRFTYNNTDLQMLLSQDELQRFYASVRLQSEMAEMIGLDSSAEYLIVAESDYDICLDAYNINPIFDEKNELREYTKRLAEQGGFPEKPWEILQIGEKNYFCQFSGWKHRAVGLYLSVDSLMQTLKNPELRKSQFLLTDTNGTVWGNSGYPLFETPMEKNLKDISTRWIIKNRYELLDGAAYLYSCENRNRVFTQIGNGMILLAAVVLLLSLFSIYLRKTIERELTKPMIRLTEDMERMQCGEYDIRVNIQTGYSEFNMLTATFNKLMDEIMGLKVAAYEKKLELQDANQKYIRLQLRPHFFLNAMTTISSLSIQGKNREIETYIRALSKNIRYMFSSGIHTVPIKDEIRHVNYYIEMQELKYPNCLFHYVDLPEELEEWEIPQMLIHTLVENEYRYAVSKGTTLMLLIRISMGSVENESMLKIEVEDNGSGYPEDVLAYMNGNGEYHPEDGSRVGLWSIRRLLELMYERTGLIELFNIEPHGACSRIYIPEKVIHEVGKEHEPESGIK